MTRKVLAASAGLNAMTQKGYEKIYHAPEQ
jgi:hypothetical protein